MADIKKLLESIDRIDEKQSSPKQTNPVAKNAMATVGGGGYGKHKDKKKDEKVGKEKHKGSFMKDLAETAEETKELRKLKESWKNFKKEEISEVSQGILKSGTIVKVPHNGKMVKGKIVRYDTGRGDGGSPFYVVDVNRYESEIVPAHNVRAIGVGELEEETDYDYYKKGLENEPFYKSVLANMNDSSEESAEEAMFKVYGMMRKNDDPEAWQSQVDTIVKMYNKVNDIGFGDSPADSLSVREGRPSQEHPLQGHEYHKKSDAELEYIAKDAREAAQAMKDHNPRAEAKYLDQANDSATVRYWRKKNGMPTWYKKMYGHEESQLNELSPDTLLSYQEKASDARKHKDLPTSKVDKRYAGVKKASDRLEKKNSEKINELSPDTLKSYDKKAMDTVSNPPQKSWVNRIQGIGRANEKLKKKDGEKLKEYGSGQSTDPNAQTTNPDKQGGVTAPPQNKATNTYTSVQKNSPQTTGTQVNQFDDPDNMINFMKDPQFVNKIKTDKNFAKTLSDVFKNAGYK